jgi:dihydroorotase
LGWSELVKKLSYNPSNILGINKGTLKPGCDADVIIVSPEKEWVVKKEGFLSKSKNSAFLGRRLKGIVEYTICKGEVVFKL